MPNVMYDACCRYSLGSVAQYSYYRGESLTITVTYWMLLHPVGCKINDLSNIQINVSGHDIKLSDSVMNLGVCLDPMQF